MESSSNRRPRRRRWLWTLPILVLIIPLAVIAPAFRPRAAAAAGEAGQWLTLKRADFQVFFAADGQLQAAQVTAITFTRHEKLAWLVEDGKRVVKGEVLAKQETQKLEDDLQRLRDELAEAERALAEQEQSLTLEKKRLETELQDEEERAKLAKMKLEEVLARPDALAKEEAANLVGAGEARLKAARAEVEILKPLAEKGFARRAEMAARETAARSAELQAESAGIRAKLIRDGATAQEKQRAALQKDMAQAALQIKQLDVQRTLAGLDQKVLAAKRRVRDLTTRKQDRERWMAESVRTAPHDGVAVIRLTQREKRKYSVGDQVSPWDAPIELPNYRSMKVRTEVSEAAIAQLCARRNARPERAGRDAEGREVHVPAQAAQPGTPARVRLKNLPDRPYPAEVVWIDRWARDRNAKLSEADIKAQGLSGVQVFPVEVELLESDPDNLREGFQATVEFPLQVIPQALAIPRHALLEGRSAVIVEEAGRRVVRPIKVLAGSESAGQVVVEEGLEEGERVWTPPLPARAPTALPRGGSGNLMGAAAEGSGPGGGSPPRGGSGRGGAPSGRRGGGR